MRDYLFFDSNRLLPGEGLKKGGRLPFKKAVFYARQLINAGFFYKEKGEMPESILPNSVLKTKEDFLFLKNTDSYVDFDEALYLKQVKGFFYSLAFSEENEKNNFSRKFKNFSQKFCSMIDNLDKAGNSLVNLLFILDEVSSLNFDNIGLFSHFKGDFKKIFEDYADKKNSFLVFPYTHMVNPFLKVFVPNFSLFEFSNTSIPFGSYNRFAKRYFFLNLPLYEGRSLPDADLLWKKIKPLIENVEDEMVFVENGEGLDFYSLKIFLKISKKIPSFRFFILEKKPFSDKYNELIEADVCKVFNPVIEGKLDVLNYIFPEYSFRHFLTKVEKKSSFLFIPFSTLFDLSDVEIEKNILDFSGLPKEEMEKLENGKCDNVLEGKGFFDGGRCLFNVYERFFKDKKFSFIEKKIIRGEKKSVIGEKDFLKKSPRKAEFAHRIDSLKNVDSGLKGFVWYCADNYSKAVKYFEESGDSFFYDFYTECLYFLNKHEKLISLCEEKKIESDFCLLAKALFQEDFDWGKDKPRELCLFEYALKKMDFALLKKALDNSRKKDAAYFRFKAILGFYVEGDKDFKKGFEKAIKQALKENNYVELALTYKYYGNALYYKEDFFGARDLFLKSMKIAVDIENEGIFDDVEYNLAHIDTVMCNLDTSYKYFYRYYISRKNIGDEEKISVLSALAKIKAFAGLPCDAEKFILETLSLAEKKGINAKLSPLYYFLVTIYQDMGDFKKAFYYLELFEKTSDIELFKKEIPYKKVELHYYEGKIEKAREEFVKCVPEEDDKLHPFLYKWFKLLLFESRLSDVYDFYFDVEKCPLRHTVFLIKTELLKKYPQIVFLTDREIERDYREVLRFNRDFAYVYRDAIVKRKKSKFDPELFVLLNEVAEHSEKGELFSVRKTLEQIAKWAGLNHIDIVPYGQEVENRWESVFVDDDKKICLVSDVEIDSDFAYLFRLILKVLSGRFNFVYTENPSPSSVYHCEFLNEIIGRSPAIEKVKENILKVADFNVPVLILGESGTGKELVARALHYCSSRRRRRFVPINCAAIPNHLLESELFGYEKGAFSGADKHKKGLLEVAGDGTVFMDEIGEMPLSLQAKLLRVLQEREFTPLGSTKIKKVNARFVFATNKKLKKLVDEGKFREDLYFRISPYVIKMPSLNERREDIPLLATYFLKINEMGRDKVFSYQALDLLKNYNYRGNVRELQNIVLRALILSGDSEIIDVEHLPEDIKPSLTSVRGSLKEAEDEFRRNYIRRVIAKCNGNITKAAKELGITRQRLHQLKKELGI